MDYKNLIKSTRYDITPRLVMTFLTPTEQRIFGVISSFTEGNAPSIAFIVKTTRLEERVVRKAIARMESIGIITNDRKVNCDCLYKHLNELAKLSAEGQDAYVAERGLCSNAQVDDDNEKKVAVPDDFEAFAQPYITKLMADHSLLPSYIVQVQNGLIVDRKQVKNWDKFDYIANFWFKKFRVLNAQFNEDNEEAYNKVKALLDDFKSNVRAFKEAMNK